MEDEKVERAWERREAIKPRSDVVTCLLDLRKQIREMRMEICGLDSRGCLCETNVRDLRDRLEKLELRDACNVANFRAVARWESEHVHRLEKLEAQAHEGTGEQPPASGPRFAEGEWVLYDGKPYQIKMAFPGSSRVNLGDSYGRVGVGFWEANCIRLPGGPAACELRAGDTVVLRDKVMYLGAEVRFLVIAVFEDKVWIKNKAWDGSERRSSVVLVERGGKR